jgi:hypothetical protein
MTYWGNGGIAPCILDLGTSRMIYSDCLLLQSRGFSARDCIFLVVLKTWAGTLIMGHLTWIPERGISRQSLTDILIHRERNTSYDLHSVTCSSFSSSGSSSVPIINWLSTKLSLWHQPVWYLYHTKCVFCDTFRYLHIQNLIQKAKCWLDVFVCVCYMWKDLIHKVKSLWIKSYH